MCRYSYSCWGLADIINICGLIHVCICKSRFDIYMDVLFVYIYLLRVDLVRVSPYLLRQIP